MTAPQRRTRRLARATGLVLLVQFSLGMVVNLYETVPRSHPGARAHEYFSGVARGISWSIRHANWSLALHAGLGLLLVLIAVAPLISAIATRTRRHIASASLGIALIIGAGFNGASFLNYGHALSSLLMAMCFILAFTIYLVGFDPVGPSTALVGGREQLNDRTAGVGRP